MLEVTDEIPGAAELIKWFGYWPSFHDAEVLDMRLDRSGCSVVRIHAWETTDRVDNRGHFICTKHVIVSFVLEEITGLDLNDFSSQNVISGLDLIQTAQGYELSLGPCYGLEGTLTAKRIRLRLDPGIPPNSSFRD